VAEQDDEEYSVDGGMDNELLQDNEEPYVTTGNTPLEETFEDELNDLKRLLGEGWKSELAGGTLGGVGGTVAGSALGALATGSPIGAAIGGVVGGAAGGTDIKETTALQGQYGHSGKLQKFEAVKEDVLHRLRELSGMIRS
jgi:hypothetical protein